MEGIKSFLELNLEDSLLKLKMVDFKKFGEMKIVNSKIEPTLS